MDQTFQNMFSREAEQIHCGDYYFSIPDIPGFDNAYTLEQEAISKGLDPEKVLKKRKDRDERMFLQSYNRRSLDCGYDEKTDWGFQRFLQGEGADKRITDIFREIAAKGIPFMDLGSYHMGMAPYILHLNPDTPCLITNREKFYISVLRSCIQENPGKQNINLAFFDGINIPLKRQSLDVVTGVAPLSGASQNRIIDGRVMSLEEMGKWCKITILMEVFRVLKPGGYFIFSETGSSLNFSWTELDAFFEKHDKIYGRYSKDEFYESLKFHKDCEKYSLNDEMIRAAGFEIEIKDTYWSKEDFENMPNWFYKEELPPKTRDLIPDDDIIEIQFSESLYVLRKR